MASVESYLTVVQPHSILESWTFLMSLNGAGAALLPGSPACNPSGTLAEPRAATGWRQTFGKILFY